MIKKTSLTTGTLLACFSSIPAYADASSINKFIKNSVIEGVIELEAGFSNDDTGNTSDITIATVELQIDSTINDKVSSHILLLHEEDDTSLEVDEATLTIDINKNMKLTAGQLYLPFGNFETNMISDSLPHEFSEARETAVQLDYKNGSITTSVYVFNGDTLETGSDESIENIGLNVAYSHNDTTLGLSYTSNLTDGDLISESLVSTPAVNSYVSGLAVYATTNFDNISVFFEYITALDEFTASDLVSNTNAKPSTINLEAGIEVDGSQYSIAYQTSDEAVDFDLPESRFLVSYSMELMKDTSLAFELASDTAYAGDKASAFTAQLAVAF